MSGRRVLVTGSAGHLGRALRARFEALGDEVVGIDLPDTGADYEYDLDGGWAASEEMLKCGPWDVVICNAKTRTWETHHELARLSRDSVINVASIYAAVGSDPAMYEGTEVEPTPAWYAASKGALVALTRWQATNFAPVRSNCIILGGIERGHSELFKQRYCARVPLKRMATEDDAVNAIEWLASDRASYISGACIPVEGGLLAMA